MSVFTLLMMVVRRCRGDVGGRVLSVVIGLSSGRLDLCEDGQRVCVPWVVLPVLGEVKNLVKPFGSTVKKAIRKAVEARSPGYVAVEISAPFVSAEVLVLWRC
jgi:hypothetical protein